LVVWLIMNWLMVNGLCLVCGLKTCHSASHAAIFCSVSLTVSCCGSFENALIIEQELQLRGLKVKTLKWLKYVKLLFIQCTSTCRILYVDTCTLAERFEMHQNKHFKQGCNQCLIAILFICNYVFSLYCVPYNHQLRIASLLIMLICYEIAVNWNRKYLVFVTSEHVAVYGTEMICVTSLRRSLFPDLNLLVAVSNGIWAEKLLQQIHPVLNWGAGAGKYRLTV